MRVLGLSGSWTMNPSKLSSLLPFAFSSRAKTRKWRSFAMCGQTFHPAQWGSHIGIGTRLCNGASQRRETLPSCDARRSRHHRRTADASRFGSSSMGIVVRFQMVFGAIPSSSPTGGSVPRTRHEVIRRHSASLRARCISRGMTFRRATGCPFELMPRNLRSN